MNSMTTKIKKKITQKPVYFIAPGQLAKDRVFGKKTSNAAYGSKRIQVLGQWKNDLCRHEMTGKVLNIVSVPRDSPGGDTRVEDDDSDCPEMWYGDSRKTAEDTTTEKARNVRGPNKNPKIISLESGEKHEIQFFNNRVVGPNHTYCSRHSGKIVRSSSICPMQVHTWKHIPKDDKEHMWAVVKECFSNPDMESYREPTLEHMGTLWTAWRSSLNTKHVIPYKKNIAFVLKNIPRGVTKKDWEWLVKEKFLTEKFQNISSKNSDNRSKEGPMPQRSGSKPHRHIIYETGGKADTPPDIAKIFCATRQRKGKFVESREQEKYDEIVNTVQANASLTPIEVVETCFGPQNHSHVFGFGGGVKRKHFKGSEAADMKALKAKLYEKEEENNDLKRRVESIESILTEMMNDKQPTSDEPPTCGDGIE